MRLAIEANDLLMFARVVDEGSLSRASLALGLPKSTVSRRLAELEKQLGERLLLRTTRKLTVTDFGHSVLEHARQVAVEVEAALSLAQHREAEPRGRLRVSMAGDFANLVLGQLMADFLARHPAVSLDIDVSPRRVDLIGENFDLAIRMGELTEDSSLTARRLALFSTGLYASPAYLQRRGEPTSPEELMSHDVLQLITQRREPLPWRLSCGTAQWQGTPPGRATANSPELLVRLARAGSGIAVVSDHFAEPYVLSGELQPVLTEWAMPPVSAWLVFPGRRLMPARTRAFLDALAAEFSETRCEAHLTQQSQVRAARSLSRRAADSA